jgi:hypothetical protein
VWVGGRTSMSSLKGMSASGCDLAPLTAKACLLAGGAESSDPTGLLRSSILTTSSDGVTTVLAASLITDEDGDGGERERLHGRRSSHANAE